MAPTRSNLDERTLAVHAGIQPDPTTGAIAPNVAMAVNFAVRPTDGGFSANDNPDMTALPYLYGVRAALRPNPRLIHAETPCNPLLRLTDLRALAELAHRHGALLSVD